MQLTQDAKMKVGQANTDAREAEKQVSKGLEDLKVLLDELQNLPPLDVEAVAGLLECLDEVQCKLEAADLDENIKTEIKNYRRRWLKQVQHDHHLMRTQMNNIKNILGEFPDDCSNSTVLEPTEGPSRPASFR